MGRANVSEKAAAAPSHRNLRVRSVTAVRVACCNTGVTKAASMPGVLGALGVGGTSEGKQGPGRVDVGRTPGYARSRGLHREPPGPPAERGCQASRVPHRSEGAERGPIQGQSRRHPGRSSLYPQGEGEDDEEDDPYDRGQRQKQSPCFPPPPPQPPGEELRESGNHRLSR